MGGSVLAPVVERDCAEHGARAEPHQIASPSNWSQPTERRKAAPIAEGGRLAISVLHVLVFIVNLVGFILPLSFSPGGCTRAEGFMVTLTINKDDP
jgi:hypothetical protein